MGLEAGVRDWGAEKKIKSRRYLDIQRTRFHKDTHILSTEQRVFIKRVHDRLQSRQKRTNHMFYKKKINFGFCRKYVDNLILQRYYAPTRQIKSSGK
jgi:hypothetical protein